MNCPFCGRPMTTSSPGWTKPETQNFAFGATSIAPGVKYRRREPARSASLEADVYTPALQTLITALIGAVAAATLGMLLHWEKVLVVTLTTSSLTGVLAWMILMREHRDLLWKIESIVGADLDQDGYTGQPSLTPRLEPKRSNIEATIRTENERGHLKSLRFITLPQIITDQNMVDIATLLITENRPLSRRGLSNVISDDNYTVLIAALHQSQLIEYRNGRTVANGYKLTRPGKALMQRYVVVGGGGSSGNVAE